LLGRLTSESAGIGQSAVKHFAAAALEREQGGDISKVVDHCAKGIMSIVRDLPNSFIGDMKGVRDDADARMLRRLVWRLLRNPATGVPLATLAAKTVWLPQLKSNLKSWLAELEEKSPFTREPTWEARVKSTNLPDVGPLLAVDFGQNGSVFAAALSIPRREKAYPQFST
jgi:hypothetical protein